MFDDPRKKFLELRLSGHLHHRTQRFSSYATDFRYRVKQSGFQARNNGWKIRFQVLKKYMVCSKKICFSFASLLHLNLVIGLCKGGNAQGLGAEIRGSKPKELVNLYNWCKQLASAAVILLKQSLYEPKHWAGSKWSKILGRILYKIPIGQISELQTKSRNGQNPKRTKYIGTVETLANICV